MRNCSWNRKAYNGSNDPAYQGYHLFLRFVLTGHDMDCSDTSCDSLEPTVENNKKRTPLPWAQLSIVILIQFAEPITATVIYPFINQFVRETGITGGDERKTEYFAGMIV